MNNKNKTAQEPKAQEQAFLVNTRETIISEEIVQKIFLNLQDNMRLCHRKI